MAASFLEKLKNGKVPLEVVVRGKDADENAKQIEQCLDIIKKAGVSDAHSTCLYSNI